MRKNKRLIGPIFCYGLFILGLAVVGREAPEIASLADDVSNNGMPVSCVQQSSAPATSRRIIPLETGSNGAQQVSLFGDLSPCPPYALHPLIPGQYPVRVLCVQRK